MAHIHFGAAGQANGKAVVVLLPLGGVDAVRCPDRPASRGMLCCAMRACSGLLPPGPGCRGTHTPAACPACRQTAPTPR